MKARFIWSSDALSGWNPRDAGFRLQKREEEIVYIDDYIPKKEKRNELRLESITVTDAVKLAKVAIEQGSIS
jgi:hypothetical protein